MMKGYGTGCGSSGMGCGKGYGKGGGMGDAMTMQKGSKSFGKGKGKDKGKAQGKIQSKGKGKGEKSLVPQPEIQQFRNTEIQQFRNTKKMSTGQKRAKADLLTWKQRLRQACTDEYGTLTDMSLVYTTIEEVGFWTSSLSSDRLTGVYTTESVAPSKSKAEDAVSKMAIQAEFPEVFIHAIEREKQAAITKLANLQHQDWKTRLVHGYAEEFRVPLTRDSVIYSTAQDGSGGFVSSLTSDRFLSAYQNEEPQVSKKLAEENVAMIALQTEFPTFYEAIMNFSNENAGGAISSTSPQDDSMAWRSRLGEAYGQEYGVPVTNDSIAYTTLPQDGGFMSMVIGDRFGSVHQSPNVEPTIELAEESAAMVALEAEFPRFFNAVSESSAMAGAAQPVQAGEKRKFSAMDVITPRHNPPRKGAAPDSGGRDPKSRLNQAM